MLKKLGKIKAIRQERDGPEAPPGQYVTEKFPVLTFGPTPNIDLDSWRFRVEGLVEDEATFDWDEFTSLGSVTLDAEFHCVTQWSRLDNTWEGVPFAAIMEVIRPKSEAKFVMAHCYGGYNTNLPLDLAMEEGILAHKQDGEPMGASHGWPLRLIVPSIYAWKSAKWINGIELMPKDLPGFWEQRGYHNDGDPWKEERFWPELTK